MTFADLKNDFVFRRIFARRPDLLCALLNDLLVREGQERIEEIEYLPSEQRPIALGAKLSILDVRCRERSGRRFIVEMQLLHMPGFLNRVVYNACKAYVEQLQTKEPYTDLADVVAISICDFDLWPDAEQDQAGLPRVPMLSRWNLTEQSSGNHGLLQVQYAFLELRKLPLQPPPKEPGARLWAWLFVHTEELEEIPAELPAGPYREAVELANEATFTATEMDAYRRVFDEIQQARDYGQSERAKGRVEGFVEGRTEGRARGRTEGLGQALLTILRARGLAPSAQAQAHILGCQDESMLHRWLVRAAAVATVEELWE